MSVVSETYYRTVTGDTTTAASAVEFWLDETEQMVEEYLGRRLEHATYVERVKVWATGFAYPAAVPITSVTASSSAEIYDDASLYGVEADIFPFSGLFSTDNPADVNYPGPLGGRRGSGYEAQHPYATIIYEGGWTEATMPVRLKMRIARLARAMQPGYASARADGAKMIRVGDVQVSYRDGDIGGVLDSFLPGTTAAIGGYKLDRL